MAEIENGVFSEYLGSHISEWLLWPEGSLKRGILIILSLLFFVVYKGFFSEKYDVFLLFFIAIILFIFYFIKIEFSHFLKKNMIYK